MPHTIWILVCPKKAIAKSQHSPPGAVGAFPATPSPATLVPLRVLLLVSKPSCSGAGSIGTGENSCSHQLKGQACLCQRHSETKCQQTVRGRLFFSPPSFLQGCPVQLSRWSWDRQRVGQPRFASLKERRQHRSLCARLQGCHTGHGFSPWAAHPVPGLDWGGPEALALRVATGLQHCV